MLRSIVGGLHGVVDVRARQDEIGGAVVRAAKVGAQAARRHPEIACKRLEFASPP